MSARIRITGGKFGGRFIRVPPRFPSRPTQERIREAIFSSIAPVLPGCRFCDCFAGTGAMGIEALSRGASEAVFIEKDRRIADALTQTLRSLDLQGRVQCAEALSELQKLPENHLDILFSDPPYDTFNGKLDEQPVVREAARVVRPGGLILWEHTARSVWEAPPNLKLVRQKRYGDTWITRLVVTRTETLQI